MAIAYQYDAQGYFVGAMEDYGFLPNNSTHKKPAEKDGYIPRWTGKAWTHVENHKGEEGYVNGEHFKMETYGKLPEGFSKELDTTPKTPEAAAEQRIQEINAEVSSKITSGFDYQIGAQKLRYHYDSFDQQNFADTANACILALNGTQNMTGKILWNGYRADGTLVQTEFTPQNFIAFYTAGALAHKNKCISEGTIRKNAVRAALAEGKSVAEIMAL